MFLSNVVLECWGNITCTSGSCFRTNEEAQVTIVESLL